MLNVLCEDEWVVESPMKGSLNNAKSTRGLQGHTALSSDPDYAAQPGQVTSALHGGILSPVTQG